MNKSIIVTLFEGHYHFGLVALSNSLYNQGFRGTLYAGYKGKLPFWALCSAIVDSDKWKGATILQVMSDMQIVFLPLSTDYHLTNYKPDFILQVWECFSSGFDGIHYFDPDIVISAPWCYFEEWVVGGIALCEDINSPLHENHPKRKSWNAYFKKFNILLTIKQNVYVNGGYVGASFNSLTFIQQWKQIQELMAPAIGGLNYSAFTNEDLLSANSFGPYSIFGKTDQDALNAATEVWEGQISVVGKDGMAFIYGVPLLPHALGQPKPWQKKYLKEMLAGKNPRYADIAYWHNLNGPILVFSKLSVLRKKLVIKASSFVARFYRKIGY